MKAALPETFTTWPMNIKSAQGEAAKRRYHGIEYKPDWWWLYADEPAAADHVYHGCSRPDHKSEGFGGAQLSFDLVDGRTLRLNGPWKASADRMLKDTCIDITDRYSVRGVIALRRGKWNSRGGGYFGTTEYTDLLHLDEDWVVGPYNRIEELAKSLAEERQQELHVYYQTSGGGHSFMVKPQEAAA